MFRLTFQLSSLAVLILLAGCDTPPVGQTAAGDNAAEAYDEEAIQEIVDAALREVAEASPSMFFVVSAEGGAWVPDEDEAETYALTLTGVRPDLVYFSDRPDRVAGHESVDAFVTDWQASGFADVPPNAAMVLHEEDESEDVVIVELTDPEYQVDSAELRFTASILTDEQTGGLAEYNEHADAAIPESFGETSLLIDNATIDPTVVFENDCGNSTDCENRLLDGFGTVDCSCPDLTVRCMTADSNTTNQRLGAYQTVTVTASSFAVWADYTEAVHVVTCFGEGGYHLTWEMIRDGDLMWSGTGCEATSH
jgi:hypothetical protein